jgi:hypothetical protein
MRSEQALLLTQERKHAGTKAATNNAELAVTVLQSTHEGAGLVLTMARYNMYYVKLHHKLVCHLLALLVVDWYATS